MPNPRGLVALLLLCLIAPAALGQGGPRTYLARHTSGSVRVDGRLNDPAWETAAWSDLFVDIEGVRRPVPRYATRVKLLWDVHFLYIGAQLEEPQVWGTIRQRDSVIFRDNDFEVFIDPDGDAKQYGELEINALNTVWDLFLEIPYRAGGHADDGWNIEGLQSAVQVQGTLSDPTDTDSGWTVEVAIPWRGLARVSHATAAPRPGDRWRINFSRVEWRTEIVNGVYRKTAGYREDNWAWSPQGVIDMHQPEQWGFVVFSSDGPK